LYAMHAHVMRAEDAEEPTCDARKPLI